MPCCGRAESSLPATANRFSGGDDDVLPLLGVQRLLCHGHIANERVPHFVNRIGTRFNPVIGPQRADHGSRLGLPIHCSSRE
jgi:hypothetical protein